MFFWKKKKSADVNTPVRNPDLKKAIKLFNSNKSEETLENLTKEIKNASFLVLLETNGLIRSESDIDNNVLIGKGSVIKFLKTHDQNGQRFLPIFTDWDEIDLWIKTREGFVGWIMPISDVFAWVNNSSDTGLVINPCSDRWNMDKSQIATFIKETA